MLSFDKKAIFILVLAFFLAGLSSFIGLHDVKSQTFWYVEGECGGYSDDYLEPKGRCYFAPERRGFQYGEGCDYEFSTIGGLMNPGFDEGGNPPADWTVVTGGTWITSVVYYDGGFSAKCTSSSTGHSNLKQTQADYASYLGKDIFIGAWVKTDDNRGQIFARDSNGNVCASPTHSGSGDWEWLSATGTVTADATWLDIYCYIYNDGSVDTFWFDSYILLIDTDHLDVLYDDWDFLENQLFSYQIDGLDSGTSYSIRAFGTTDDVTYTSDDFCCTTTGSSAPFPLWLILVLLAVVGLGIYTKSLILSIAGVVLCIVSYSWVLNSPSADDVGVMGGAAFFLILIAWIILNLIYREHRNG